MSGLIDRHNSRSDPVAVADDCPECGSDIVMTSAFNADHGSPYSSWCATCGYGFYSTRPLVRDQGADQ